MAYRLPSENTVGYAIMEALESLGGTQNSQEISSWIEDKYQSRYSAKTIRTYLRGCSLNHPPAIRRHPSFPRFLYNPAKATYELYNFSHHPRFDENGFAEGQAAELAEDGEDSIEVEEEGSHSRQFAYEAHLRDYLAKNLSLLEPGLVFWTGNQADSIEFGIGTRRIDILAKDRAGVPVIVELKLSKGHERTLGQALYYRGKLKQVLGLPRVRIILVAAEITDELQVASSEVTDIQLFSYELAMKIKKLGSAAESN